MMTSFPRHVTRYGRSNLQRSSAHMYVHGHEDAVLRSHRWRNVENSAAFIRPYLRSGVRVLDCGCGPGSLAKDIAKHCGSQNVVGVDNSGSAIEAAVTSFPDQEFVHGDIMELPFDDNVFDVVFGHQVIQYLSDPFGGLAEMKRVCKPGGVVAVREGDVDGFIWMPHHDGFKKFRKGYKEAVRCNGGDAAIAAKLPLYSQRVGFEKLDVSASTWCFSERRDREWWGKLWLDRVQQGKIAEVWEKHGVIEKKDVEEMTEGLRMFIDREDGLFVLTHVEVVCHKGGEPCGGQGQPQASSRSGPT